MGPASIASGGRSPRHRPASGKSGSSKISPSPSSKSYARSPGSGSAKKANPSPRPGGVSKSSPKMEDTTASSANGSMTAGKTQKSPMKELNNGSRHGMDFTEYTKLSQRLTKSMYYAKKMPTLSRPSFPLTVLAVNTFTSTHLGTELNTLEFLDLELASEIGLKACVSPTTLVMAFVYLDRIYNSNPMYLKTIKPSELFVVALLVASKFVQDDGEDDCCIYNDEWASAAGLEIKQLNRLEIEFLTAIDWNLNVKRTEFDKVLQNLESKLAQQESRKRNGGSGYTYTELEALSNTILTWNLLWPTVYEYILKVILATSIAYATLITTLVTSSYFAPQLAQFCSRSLTTSTTSSLSTSPQYAAGTGSVHSPLSQQPDLHNTTDTDELLDNLTNAFINQVHCEINLHESPYANCSAYRTGTKPDNCNLKDGNAFWSFNFDSGPFNNTGTQLDSVLEFRKPTPTSIQETRLKRLLSYQNRFRNNIYNSCSPPSAPDAFMRFQNYRNVPFLHQQKLDPFTHFISL